MQWIITQFSCIGMFLSWFFINKMFEAYSHFAFNCKEWSLSVFGWTWTINEILPFWSFTWEFFLWWKCIHPEIGKTIFVLITKYFLMNLSNQFLLNVPSNYIPSENIRKPYISFMMFSGSIKREHWEDMG